MTANRTELPSERQAEAQPSSKRATSPTGLSLPGALRSSPGKLVPGPNRAYKVFGHIGLVLGSALALGIAAYRGLSLPVVLAAIGAGYAVSFLLALATKVVHGEEKLVFYHYLVAVGGCGFLVPPLAGAPPLPYLEVLVLGLGLMQACGRLGCLRVGCCHGRPSGRGIRYGESHRRMGFPAHLVGVRLFPVQAVEASWSAGVVFLGASMVLRGAPAGAGLGVYLAGYAAGRFFLELLRGDTGRRFWLGLSESQWTSLVLLTGTLAAGAGNRLPLAPGAAAAGGGVLVAAAFLVAWTRCGRTQRARLLSPRHVEELAEALARLHRAGPLDPCSSAPPEGTSRVPLATTAQGLQVSTGTVRRGRRIFRLYSLSLLRELLQRPAAVALGRVLACLHHPGEPYVLLEGGHGVVHVLVARPRPSNRLRRSGPGPTTPARGQHQPNPGPEPWVLAPPEMPDTSTKGASP